MKFNYQLTILMLMVPWSAWCQNDTTFYFGVNGKTCDLKDTVIKKEITYISDKDVTIETSNFKDGKWNLALSEKMKKVDENEYKVQIKGTQFSGNAVREFEKSGNNKFKFTDRMNKRIIRTGETLRRIPLIFDGEVTEYYKNGDKKSLSVYENNQLVSNKNWLENGDPYIDNVFYSVDQEPFYKMGMPIVHTNLRNAFVNSSVDISRMSGTIMVGFVVMEDGSIDGIRIEEGLKKELDQVALDAFRQLPDGWQPAQLNDSIVRYYQLFPINFINKEKKFEINELYGREISTRK